LCRAGHMSRIGVHASSGTRRRPSPRTVDSCTVRPYWICRLTAHELFADAHERLTHAVGGMFAVPDVSGQQCGPKCPTPRSRALRRPGPRFANQSRDTPERGLLDIVSQRYRDGPALKPSRLGTSTLAGYALALSWTRRGVPPGDSECRLSGIFCWCRFADVCRFSENNTR
jgi:hypothetical protein